MEERRASSRSSVSSVYIARLAWRITLALTLLALLHQIKGEWKTEIVRDINVINAYVRKRQMLEERETAAEAVAPTGDEDKDKRMKK